MADANHVVRTLARKGFDIGQAMETCAEDMELYIEVLRTALEEGRRKYEVMAFSLENGDYERYHVEVHALKNSARAIGALELSELSAGQERAVKRGDYVVVMEEGAELLAAYGEVIGLLGELLD